MAQDGLSNLASLALGSQTCDTILGFTVFLIDGVLLLLLRDRHRGVHL